MVTAMLATATMTPVMAQKFPETYQLPADRHRHDDLAAGYGCGPGGVSQPVVPGELLRY